jgi:hypothetical protein
LDPPPESWKQKLTSFKKVPLYDKIIFSNNFKAFQRHAHRVARCGQDFLKFARMQVAYARSGIMAIKPKGRSFGSPANLLDFGEVHLGSISVLHIT